MPLVTSNPKKRVILGLMTFGPEGSDGARVTSLDEFNSCLDYLQKQGYNEVDTAEAYCSTKQQAFTAQAKWRERGLKLATKYYPNPIRGGHTPENIRQKLEWNLSQLNADCVDIFYLHAADRSINFAETLEEVNKLHKEGKFVQLGLSNFTAFEIAEIVIICNERGWVQPTIYQGMYNAITRAIEQELVVACRRYGLDIVIYNPLGGSLFAGKIKSQDIPAEGRFSNNSAAGDMYRKRYFRDATFDALRLIESAAQKHNLTLLEIALRWMMHHSALNVNEDGGDGIIIGVSSLSQLESNLKDLEKGPLPDEVVKTLDDAWMITKSTTPNYWHLDLKYTYDTKALFRPKPKA